VNSKRIKTKETVIKAAANSRCCNDSLFTIHDSRPFSRFAFHGLKVVLLFLAFLAISGCGSPKWALNSDLSETHLYWMEAPRKAKLTHVMSIKGFDETGTSVRTIIFGKSKITLARPVAFASGSDGRFAIADTGSRCVHYYVPAEQRYLNLSSLASEQMLSPVSVAFDDEMRLYISDSALGKIFVVDRQGSYLFSISASGEGPLKRPTGLAWDSDKKLLFAVDTLAHKIYAFNKNGEAVSSFGSRGDKAGQFNFPTHIFWSPSGLLYVTDAMNFRIQVFSDGGRFVTSFGHHGDGSGDFSSPKGVVVDKTGVIYVVDTLFDNIQLFDERGDFLLTLGSRGGGQGEFWLPSGLYLDEREKLYVSDTYNQRVQVFQLIEDIIP
jgi:DNA-binding beta-propeller fold protein YncE